MSKEIWLGPVLGNNRLRLIKRCAGLVANGRPESLLYLAASHPLLEVVTAGILDGKANSGVWGELPVYLFRGFVRRILSSTVDESGDRLAPPIPIDREELPLKRSLISQILARLFATGRLKALAPLAGREGCVNTIATLLGEIQRAAKTPPEFREIIAARAQDSSLSTTDKDQDTHVYVQSDFDKDVALIYEIYRDALDRHQLTEDDADGLLALSALSGEMSGQRVQVSWLADVQLLVLDGFFDFTPAQGEMLKLLIPRIPEVIVNLNYDERNPEIFRPFQETIGQLQSMAQFQIKPVHEQLDTSGALSTLRERLFNPLSSASVNQSNEIRVTDHAQPTEEVQRDSEIRYFDCADRETETRVVAKEIKRLVLLENYKLADIALVVRERASYAETIERVMREESVPCRLERRIDANEISSVRAASKLFTLLEEMARDPAKSLKVLGLADLIKSGYFRLGKANLADLAARFEAQHINLLRESIQPLDVEEEERLKNRFGIGRWDADILENSIAYVGAELRVTDWLTRARKLIEQLPSAPSTRELLNIEPGEPTSFPDEADAIQNAETAEVKEKDSEKKRRPSRDVHPATIAWASLVIQHLASRIQGIPLEGKPAGLRVDLMKLLEQFRFQDQVSRPIRNATEDRELPRATLDFHGLEALRRAFVAAIKSIEIAEQIGDSKKLAAATKLATFLEEVRRCLNSQTQLGGGGDRSGLSVLEATDVRGLRFRAVFIAGLVEGGFPLRASRDWIYPHEERERLKLYGLTLEDISPATLLKEEHYFYQAACCATDRLYLTRPLLLEDDSETVASYYIDELRHAVAPAQIKIETVRRDYEGKHLPSVSREGELAIALVRQEERHNHRGQKKEVLPLARISQLLSLARNDGYVTDAALRRIAIERERASFGFGPYDGQITDSRLLALVNRRFDEDFVHSASGLSTFGNCPYRFFAQRVLKLEPRGEAALDLQAIDAGKLLHDILRRFFEQHRRQTLTTLDREGLRRELAEIADRVFDEHERVVPALNKQIWKIDREIRKILLDQVLLYELDVQENAVARNVVPAHFELAFGMKSAAMDPMSKASPLELSRSTVDGEETVKISGQIDRVDIAKDDTIIAYDYKLSTGSNKEDMKAGRSLQIPIYLEALEQLILPNHSIAGGGYYVIRGGIDRRNKGLHRASQLSYSGIGSKAGAVVPDDEWQQIREAVIAKIWEFLDLIRSGRFAVTPSEGYKTCRFCDFAAVCRYERYRIQRKLDRKHESSV